MPPLDQTSFQENVFKVVKNGERSGYVDRQHGQIDCRKSVFLQTKATHFETIATVNVNSYKTNEFIFRSDSRVCFTAEINISY